MDHCMFGLEVYLFIAWLFNVYKYSVVKAIGARKSYLKNSKAKNNLDTPKS